MKIKDYKPGMKIKSGMAIRNMPSEVYHKHPALSNSGLKTLLDCPYRYFYKYLSGAYTQKETPALKIGKAAHCYILEGSDEFHRRYYVNRYSKCLKADMVTFLMARGYKEDIKKLRVDELTEMLLTDDGINLEGTELSQNEWEQVGLLARAIIQNPLAYNAFKQKGESEISLFWEDKETGVMLKCRPDWLPYDLKNIPDYKTCCSVQPVTFAKDFIKYGYHIQAAFYAMGIKEVFGAEVENFFFVAQEKEEPNISQVFLPDSSLIEQGYKAIRNGIHKLIDCNTTGFWDTYSSEVIEISLAPKPDDLPNYYDKASSVVYLPMWIDSEFAKYEG